MEKLLIVLTVLLALALSACTPAAHAPAADGLAAPLGETLPDARMQDPAPQAGSGSVKDSLGFRDQKKSADTQPASAPVTITLEEAKAMVFAHLGISEADTFDRDYDFDDGVFEISFQLGDTEYEVKVSTAGEILRIEKELDDDYRPQTPPATEAPTTPAAITLEEAKAIAFAHLGISEADTFDRDYDFDDGIFEISFQIGHLEYEVEVSTTGEILRVEKEVDD